ncbi:hypothetical protein BC833DRAFT_594655 [Globomyces pollinis-pini]|nr:hypothetical protein BC833DRAFT_594655 [Globomyces pollinis-pini]
MGSKSLRQKAEFHFKKFMNLSKIRSIRRFYHSLLLNFICKAFYVFVVLLMLIIGISNLQDLWFPSVHYYNVIHIVINIVGHLLLLAVYDLCKVIHVTVLAGMVCRKGVTINNLSEGPFNGNIPGVKIRQIMMGLALFIEASIIVSSYYMDFTLTPSYYKTGMCIDATYPSFPPIPEGLMNHLLGNAESTNLHYTSLPLADGLVGGCAVWPLEDIPYDFEVKGPGSVYSATSYCYEEVSAKTKVTETRTKLIDMKESTHSVYGQILVQTPAGKMNSSIDVGYGVEQICTFSVKFGTGDIRSSFIVDEWHKLTLSKLLEIDIPNAPTVVKGDSNDIFERQISVHLQDDTYGFVPYIASMLETLIGTNAQNSTEHEKILSYAALPDGLIYPDRMWNGT